MRLSNLTDINDKDPAEEIRCNEDVMVTEDKDTEEMETIGVATTKLMDEDPFLEKLVDFQIREVISKVIKDIPTSVEENSTEQLKEIEQKVTEDKKEMKTTIDQNIELVTTIETMRHHPKDK